MVSNLPRWRVLGFITRSLPPPPPQAEFILFPVETKMAACYISTIIRNRGLQTVYLIGKVDESKRLWMEHNNTYTKQLF